MRCVVSYCLVCFCFLFWILLIFRDTRGEISCFGMDSKSLETSHVWIIWFGKHGFLYLIPTFENAVLVKIKHDSSVKRKSSLIFFLRSSVSNSQMFSLGSFPRSRCRTSGRTSWNLLENEYETYLVVETKRKGLVIISPINILWINVLMYGYSLLLF